MAEGKITDEQVRQVARLAHLTLSDQECASLRQDLDAILGYVAQLEELDVTGVEPTTHAVALTMTLRQDQVVQHLDQEAILANAPEREDGMFRVPRAVEGGN